MWQTVQHNNHLNLHPYDSLFRMYQERRQKGEYKNHTILNQLSLTQLVNKHVLRIPPIPSVPVAQIIVGYHSPPLMIFASHLCIVICVPTGPPNGTCDTITTDVSSCCTNHVVNASYLSSASRPNVASATTTTSSSTGTFISFAVSPLPDEYFL